MDQSEQKALEFLESQGFQRIVYEPDGNVPPDFLLDGRIAVEVRRLNQNAPTEAGFKGLEEDGIPLLHRMRRLLHSLGPAEDDASWFVFYHFRRPLPDWSKLEPQIRSGLEAFSPVALDAKAEVQVINDFTLWLHRAGQRHGDRFVLGGYGDHDAGGWVVPELARNLNLCITEKWAKIDPVRTKYPEWWLLLLDRINYGSADVLEDGLGEMGINRAGWDRIILIDPTNPLRFHEV
jgi:hypothetical protein